jgi:diphthamide synthase (EF-2-diphthine--ammonia ligase)
MTGEGWRAPRVEGEGVEGRTRTWLSWSSGKDSAWALHVLRWRPDLEVTGLFTTINATVGRVPMHGLRLELLRRQAEATGLALHVAEIPTPCPNEVYERAMRALVDQALADGVRAMAFGDLYLEDIRAYRERNLAGTGVEPIFPLWGFDTAALARDMIAGGLRARVVCVDPRALPAELCGRLFDETFLRDLPPGADPCGEHGEFHTFEVSRYPKWPH